MKVSSQASSEQQMLRIDLKLVGRCCLPIVMLGHPYPLSGLSLHHLLRDSAENCQCKEVPFYPIADLYFNQEPIRLQHGPVEILIFPPSSSLNIVFQIGQMCYHYFCYFSVFLNKLF